MKNLFSLDWFKSERQVELEQLKNKEQKLKNKLLEQQLDNKKDDLGYVLTFNNGKPYNNLRLINNILSVTLRDNTLLTKTNATEKDYYDIKAASLEEEVISIMICPEQKEERDALEKEYRKKETLRNGIEFLTKFSMFTVKNDSLYLKGVDRSIPQLLAERFLEITDGLYFEEEVERSIEFCSLRKFWLKCCLNPNAQSAEDLYVFLAHHQFNLDNHGNFYAYRRVVSKTGTDVELVDFISNTYNKVKAIWKKKPIDFEVFDDNGYVLVPSQKQNHGYNKHVGNLQDLYLDLPNMSSNSYTSAHTGREDYKVGSVISMPRHQGDDNNQMSCSKGFHAASKEYDYSGFGDTPILVIINPMDVLSVPIGEVGKLRTCRWFFAMTLTEDEEHILDDQDFDVTDLGDVFEEACGQDLENYVLNSFTEEVQRHTFTIPQMSNMQINKIVKSLNQMKDEIEKRVQSII